MAPTMELDVARHPEIPDLEEGGTLHVRLPGGGRKQITVNERVAHFNCEDWDEPIDAEAVYAGPGGRWVLVTDWGGTAEVIEFGGRQELCEYLWDVATVEPAALPLLFRLGHLRLEVGPAAGPARRGRAKRGTGR